MFHVEHSFLCSLRSLHQRCQQMTARERVPNR